MKVGLSYSRCVRDIVEGKVDLSEVLVIIAGTRFDPNDDQHWKLIWNSYTGGRGLNMAAWPHDSDQEFYRTVSKTLYNTGRLHQPRDYGHNPYRPSYHWLETVLVSEDLEKSTAARTAWEQFKVVSGLAGVDLVSHNTL